MTRPLWAPWRLAYIGEAGSQETCVFCAEAGGELGEESLLVARGEHAFVLLNKFPYSSGHLMVATLRHVGELDELSAVEAAEIMERLRISQLLVIDARGALAGALTTHDLMLAKVI